MVAFVFLDFQFNLQTKKRCQSQKKIEEKQIKRNKPFSQSRYYVSLLPLSGLSPFPLPSRVPSLSLCASDVYVHETPICVGVCVCAFRWNHDHDHGACCGCDVPCSGIANESGGDDYRLALNDLNALSGRNVDMCPQTTLTCQRTSKTSNHERPIALDVKLRHSHSHALWNGKPNVRCWKCHHVAVPVRLYVCVMFMPWDVRALSRRRSIKTYNLVLVITRVV